MNYDTQNVNVIYIIIRLIVRTKLKFLDCVVSCKFVSDCQKVKYNFTYFRFTQLIFIHTYINITVRVVSLSYSYHHVTSSSVLDTFETSRF